MIAGPAVGMADGSEPAELRDSEKSEQRKKGEEGEVCVPLP